MARCEDFAMTVRYVDALAESLVLRKRCYVLVDPRRSSDAPPVPPLYRGRNPSCSSASRSTSNIAGPYIWEGAAARGFR